MAEGNIKFTKKNDVTPKCPHCNQSLNEVYTQQKGIGILFAKSTFFFCPTCLKLLGIGQTALG